MKNLKKVLSLALVLVLALGLFVTASAADYKDQDDIKYVEAVDVLSGIGILEGMPDGTFNPQGNVTRAQAAKILAYLMLGRASADALVANEAPFDDVAADHWAAGYIQFCANQGIVAGVGGNKFNPLGNVTAAQFARMLLSALGYGENNEFIGDNWKTNVTKYAARAKIFAGNYAANPDSAATREEAALYAFNAMTKTSKVTYAPILNDYINRTNVLGSDAESLGTFADDYNLWYTYGNVDYDADDGFIVPANYVYGVDAEPSDIGREVKVWYQGNTTNKVGVAVAGPYYQGTTLAIKYNNTDAGDWTTRYLGSRRNADYVAAANANVSYIVDGMPFKTVPAKTVYNADGTVKTPGDYGKGDKVEIIDSDYDGKFDLVLITTYKAANMGAKPYVTNKNGTVTVNFATGKLDTREAENFVGFDKLDPYTVIYYNYNYATQTYYAYVAEAVEGQKTTQNFRDAVITFAGMMYGTSGLDKSAVIFDTQIINDGTTGMAFATDSVIYLDASGAVICYSQEVAALNYVVLADAAAKSTGGLLGGTTFEAQLVFPEGKVEIHDISSITVGENVYAVYNDTLKTVIDPSGYVKLSDSDPAGLRYQWYTYTVTNGVYALKAVGAPFNNDAITTGKVRYDGATLSNNKTIFVAATLNALGKPVYSFYTGYAAVPTSSIAVDNQAVLGAQAVARYVFIDATMDPDFGASTVVEYAFIPDGFIYTTYNDKTTNAELYVYTAVVKGALGTVTATNNSTITPANLGLYAIARDANGYVVGIGSDDTLFNSDGALQIVSNDLLKVGEDAFAYNAKSVAYIYDADGNLTVGTVADLVAVQADAVFTSIKRAGDASKPVAYQTVAEIYVVLAD